MMGVFCPALLAVGKLFQLYEYLSKGGRCDADYIQKIG